MFRRNFEGRFNNHRGHMMNRDGFDFGKGLAVIREEIVSLRKGTYN